MNGQPPTQQQVLETVLADLLNLRKELQDKLSLIQDMFNELACAALNGQALSNARADALLDHVQGLDWRPGFEDAKRAARESLGARFDPLVWRVMPDWVARMRAVS